MVTSRALTRFFLGAVMDYQMDADVVWQNAEELVKMLGADNLWKKIATMTEDNWLNLRKRDGGYYHRLWGAPDQRSIAKRIRRIATNVVNKFNGDVRNVWRGRTADEVYEVLRNDVRVNLSRSDATINMIVLGLQGAGVIKGSSNVKADMHVKRVLGRAIRGRAIDRDVDAIQLAQRICPENPGDIDLALFDIGKEYCKPTQPRCSECPLGSICKYKRTHYGK
jgi:endonuclease-3